MALRLRCCSHRRALLRYMNHVMLRFAMLRLGTPDPRTGRWFARMVYRPRARQLVG